MTMNKALIALALGFALAACSNQEQAADAAADAAATATELATCCACPDDAGSKCSV